MRLRAHHENVYTCHKFVSTLLRNPYCCTIHSVPEKRNYCSGKVQPFSDQAEHNMMCCIEYVSGFKEPWREESLPDLPASQMELSRCILNTTKQFLHISKRSTENNCTSKLYKAKH